MSKRTAAGVIVAILLASCAEAPKPPPVAVAPAPPPETRAPVAPALPALTLDGYKKLVATRIAQSNQELLAGSLPQMLKSVVVLSITVDRDGGLAQVSVRRSNGFKALEQRAMDSVRRAAPFTAPNLVARRGDESLSFLETFLFRDDGRFQVRSLVAN
jgi:protein TonB